MLKKNKRVCNVIDNSVIFFFLSDNLVSTVYIMYVCTNLVSSLKSCLKAP